MSNFFERLGTGILLIVPVMWMWGCTSPHVTSVVLAIIALYTLFVEWPRFKCWWLTPLYPVLPYVLLILFNSTVYRSELLWLLCVAVTHDSCAYAVGKLLGATKLWPRVSPGKTWEGFFGGVLGSIIISRLLLTTLVSSNSFLLGISLITYSGVTILVNIACVAGDLFESWLKRRAHLKDSGTILPGHGGVLDRLDSLLGAIIMWVIVHFFIKYFTLL